MEDSVSQPIIGFYVQNKQGLQIFGHNTYSYLPEGFGLVAGKTIGFPLIFSFPLLSAGYYFLSAAVSSGTQADHSVLAWMTHIVGFRSDYADPGLGIFGTPLEKITISEIAFGVSSGRHKGTSGGIGYKNANRFCASSTQDRVFGRRHRCSSLPDSIRWCRGYLFNKQICVHAYSSIIRSTFRALFVGSRNAVVIRLRQTQDFHKTPLRGCRQP